MLGQETVYVEASSWVRTANSIIWQVGAIFVPLSIGAFVYAAEKQEHVYWLAFGSIFLWFMWVYVYELYGRAVVPCRQALEDIEKKCEVGEAQAFYARQASLMNGRWGSRYLFYTSSAILLVAWSALIVHIKLSS